ncbi:hypothetical protein WME78_22970 [Sorangium sp. So ce1097]
MTAARWTGWTRRASSMYTEAPMDTTHEATDEAQDEAGQARPVRPEDQDPKLWRGSGWTARVIKNEDDDGWAVEMTCDGQSEPSLVGPWTMGRDKKNPKPLDASAFATLVKTANEVLARHVQQRRALLHRNVTVAVEGGARVRVDLDVVPDEDDPHAILTVHDAAGEVVSRSRVPADFKLTTETARRWLQGGAAAS